MKKPNIIVSVFITLEILFGIIGGIILINKPDRSMQSLFNSILYLYLSLNAIFFIITVIFGVICAVFLKLTDRIAASILLSLALGLCFLALHAFVFTWPVFSFLSLFGFIIGFNLYLLKKQKTMVSN